MELLFKHGASYYSKQVPGNVIICSQSFWQKYLNLKITYMLCFAYVLTGQ